MSFLFVDSSYDISLGILDENYRWVDFRSFSEKKASTVLQTETFQIFTQHGLKVKDISALVTVAGPGFYTGLRLSEGLADVFKFFGVPHYSFFSYEVPYWSGQEKGVWFTKAYRGEYFFYEWDGATSKSELVLTKDVEARFKNLSSTTYIHSDGSLDTLSSNAIINPISTLSLLKKSSGELFKKIISEKMWKDSYYFRAPEDEFRVNP